MRLNLKDIGERLKELRGRGGATQKAWGENVGIGQSSVGKIERGESSPSLDYLQMASEKGNETVDWILFGQDMVPHGRFHAERERRKAAEEELSRLKPIAEYFEKAIESAAREFIKEEKRLSAQGQSEKGAQ